MMDGTKLIHNTILSKKISARAVQQCFPYKKATFTKLTLYNIGLILFFIFYSYFVIRRKLADLCSLHYDLVSDYFSPHGTFQ